VYCEQNEVVAQLVAQDADITAQAEFPDLDWGCINAGDTPMHIAAHRGNIDAIQIMLKAYVSTRAQALQDGCLLLSWVSAQLLQEPVSRHACISTYSTMAGNIALPTTTWLALSYA
jgi:hypothetical protein